MTRDETVVLFMECEAKRIEVRSAALAEGKSVDDASKLAHEAAKTCWNAWAEALLAERMIMEAAGRWPSEKRVWEDRAKVDFNFCLFLDNGVDEQKEAEGKAVPEAGAANRKQPHIN